jgi:hypothetical protein
MWPASGFENRKGEIWMVRLPVTPDREKSVGLEIRDFRAEQMLDFAMQFDWASVLHDIYPGRKMSLDI